MNSKECLEAILDILNYEQVDECDKKSLLRTIKQDLERLERLEKENQELKETINDLQKDYDALDFEQVELYAENTKLKQALDKSCERFSYYTCPVSEELIEDLDCKNCKDNYKECWVKFFLKEVLDCD